MWRTENFMCQMMCIAKLETPMVNLPCPTSFLRPLCNFVASSKLSKACNQNWSRNALISMHFIHVSSALFDRFDHLKAFTSLDITYLSHSLQKVHDLHRIQWKLFFFNFQKATFYSYFLTVDQKKGFELEFWRR